MNGFEQQAANMTAYQEGLAACDNKPTGGSLVKYRNQNYVATVGPFEVRQVLGVGGFTPESISEVIIQKAILPLGTVFKTGNDIEVTQLGGSVYQCRVHLTKDTYTEWRLQVNDKNFKA